MKERERVGGRIVRNFTWGWKVCDMNSVKRNLSFDWSYAALGVNVSISRKRPKCVFLFLWLRLWINKADPGQITSDKQYLATVNIPFGCTSSSWFFEDSIDWKAGKPLRWMKDGATECLLNVITIKQDMPRLEELLLDNRGKYSCWGQFYHWRKTLRQLRSICALVFEWKKLVMIFKKMKDTDKNKYEEVRNQKGDGEERLQYSIETVADRYSVSPTCNAFLATHEKSWSSVCYTESIDAKLWHLSV